MTMTTEPAPVVRRRRMPRALRSVRAQVIGAVVLLLVTGLAVSGLLTRTVQLADVDERASQAVAQEVQEFRERAESDRNPVTGEPWQGVEEVLKASVDASIPEENQSLAGIIDGEVAAMTVQEDVVDLNNDPAALAVVSGAGNPGYGTGMSSDGEFRYAVVPVSYPGETRDVRFVAMYLEAEEYAEVDGIVGNLVVVYLAVVVVVALVGWLLLGQLLAPLRELRLATTEVGDTELSRRVPVHGDDEISELAHRFNAMLDRLQAAFESQRELLDDIGHELRTPVTILRGHVEMLDVHDADDVQATRELLLDELDRMSRMVDDLITLAKLERPDFIATAMVDLTVLTDEIAEKLTGLATRAWRVDALAGGSAMVDRDRLTQALVQLAQNAVTHTQEGAEIAVGSRRLASPDGDRLQLWVRDTGPGVAPEDEQRIFARFGRGGDQARDSGTGLGLAIVQAIATGHGGRLLLHNDPGSGATFLLDLPWFVVAEPHSDRPTAEADDDSLDGAPHDTDESRLTRTTGGAP